MSKSPLPSSFETATNEYKSEGSIGNGGCGTVFRVRDSDNSLYALKLLTEVEAIKRKRFKNELTFCQENRHPHIVKVLDHGVAKSGDESRPFYVMPLYQSSLRTLMKKGIASEDVLKLFSDMLDGVEAAHLLGVFHRDLKPENLLVELPGPRIVVADFGIAHFEEELLKTIVETKVGDRVGNYLYSAPEQRITGPVPDHRADIFALGLILNEMFTGEVPHGTGHKPITSVEPDFAYLDPIVEKMIRQKPAERHGSIREIKSELNLYADEFVAHQKLDQIRKTVVPATKPEDPLDGIDVSATEFSYDDSGHLTFRLEPKPPSGWIVALNASALRGDATGYTRADIDAQGKSRIHVHFNLVVERKAKVIRWVTKTNADYRETLSQEARASERRALEDQVREKQKSEQRLQALKLLQG